MRRSFLWLSITIACLSWVLGAPALHAEISAPAHTSVPTVELSSVAATTELVAILPSSALRAVVSIPAFAFLTAATALLVALFGIVARRGRGWSDVLTRCSIRTRGPPRSPSHLPAAS